MIVYKSRTDWWTWPVLIVPPLSGMISIATAHDRVQVYIGCGVIALFALIFFGLVLPMRYSVGDQLEIRAGMLMRIRIPWDRVVEMKPTNNPLSSPALSLQRLEIRYTRPSGSATTVMISPTDRAQFVADCARASGRHRAEGEALLPIGR